MTSAGDAGTIAGAALPAALVAAIEAFARHPRVLVALDFDGVLAPIVLVPDAARPLPEAAAGVRRLAQSPGVAVALVSGRVLDNLRRVAAPPPSVSLIGSHGAQYAPALPEAASVPAARVDSAPGPGRIELDPPAADRLAAVTEALELISARYPGTFVERKPAGAVLHTRQAGARDAATATGEALAGPATWPGVHLTLGKEVVDLSVLAVTKGMALNRLRADLALCPGQGPVLYVGDDVTDERAFAVLDPAAGDVSVKVGDGRTMAGHRIPDPEAVVLLLDHLLACRGADSRRS